MRRSIGVVLALATWATIAKADDEMPLLQTVGLWQVRIDTSLNNSCFIINSWTGSTIDAIKGSVQASHRQVATHGSDTAPCSAAHNVVARAVVPGERVPAASSQGSPSEP
jgi:hypothetical protein